jgi:hypothetical protein
MLTSVHRTRFARLSLILLIAVASLPEVVCCCGLSYGVGGLFGHDAKCQASAATKKACSCCAKKQLLPAEQDSVSSDRGCGCKFYLATSAPMVDSRHIDVDLTMLVVPFDSVLSLRVNADVNGPRMRLVAEPPVTSCSGARSRCARLQSWQV